MSASAALTARLLSIMEDSRDDPSITGACVSLDWTEFDLLIAALSRPAAPTCASTTNYPIMAERALRLITRNGIRDNEAIEMVTHLVDCAGLDYAKEAVEADDAVPF